jgi:hypothetical protein
LVLMVLWFGAYTAYGAAQFWLSANWAGLEATTFVAGSVGLAVCYITTAIVFLAVAGPVFRAVMIAAGRQAASLPKA